jgi:hypothetical protein
VADWRLQGQEKYLLGATLRWQRYHAPRTDWDHDHCEFCWRAFSERGGDRNEGYVTADNYRWICRECFDDFKEQFGWKVERAEAGESDA